MYFFKTNDLKYARFCKPEIQIIFKKASNIKNQVEPKDGH